MNLTTVRAQLKDVRDQIVNHEMMLKELMREAVRLRELRDQLEAQEPPTPTVNRIFV